jgi:hypothetical protein
LTTRAYVRELANGTVDEYTANVIAENLIHKSSTRAIHLLMNEITNHRKDGAALDQQTDDGQPKR